MLIHSAKFVGSYTDYKNCPSDSRPEFAFIGRSNVGKSSLINSLCNNQKLANVSSTPGKTQLINYYLINNKWYLVDLPGYGWAKVSKDKKKQWEAMIKNYLLYRHQLTCVFCLVDSNLPPQEIDINFINWLGTNGIPLVIIFTKADKNSKNKIGTNIAKIKTELLKTWEELPAYFMTSSKTHQGREDILRLISDTLQSLNSPGLNK
ncbi:MAG: ribosome biogenesis GTP-binding protein YihA/YsxC [Cytophagaceae bacterium]|nr:ribosome biogenesis GTP-binding protein YihA/YsxC [Cytophagaceae bacterium]MDW8455507.1 ribosome biogenesis GTP-binding protein YihA/YsxC [Cytophagaceae bacterium]